MNESYITPRNSLNDLSFLSCNSAVYRVRGPLWAYLCWGSQWDSYWIIKYGHHLSGLGNLCHGQERRGVIALTLSPEKLNLLLYNGEKEDYVWNPDDPLGCFLVLSSIIMTINGQTQQCPQSQPENSFFLFSTIRFFLFFLSFFLIIILERESRMKVTEVNNSCSQASGSKISLLRGLSPTVSVLSVNINIKHLLLSWQVLYSERTKPSLGEQPIQVEGLKLPNSHCFCLASLSRWGMVATQGICGRKPSNSSSSSCVCGDSGSQPWTHSSAWWASAFNNCYGRPAEMELMVMVTSNSWWRRETMSISCSLRLTAGEERYSSHQLTFLF